MPNGAEGLLEQIAHGLQGQRRVAGHLQVLDAVALIAGVDVIGVFRAHFQAKVFQHRYDAGQRQRVAPAEQFQLNLVGALSRLALGFWAVEAHAQIVAVAERQKLIDIVAGDLLAEPFLIVRGEAVSKGQPVHPGRSRLQHGAQFSLPVAGEGQDFCFQPFAIEVDIGDRVDPKDVLQAHEHALGKEQLELDIQSPQAFAQQLLDTHAHPGAQRVSRHVDHAVVKHAVAPAPEEHPGQAAFVDVGDRGRRIEQAFPGRLEQLIARVGVEDLAQRLGVVGPHQVAGFLHDP